MTKRILSLLVVLSFGILLVVAVAAGVSGGFGRAEKEKSVISEEAVSTERAPEELRPGALSDEGQSHDTDTTKAADGEETAQRPGEPEEPGQSPDEAKEPEEPGLSGDEAEEEENGLFPEDFKVRGIYISAWLAGTEELMSHVLYGMEGSELNSIVIDVKDDEGRVVWDSDSALIDDLGAERVCIRDLPALIEELHSRGIYCIGRLVAFRDSYIHEVRPDWVFHNPDGTVYLDEKDFAWIDPGNAEARAYLLEVGRSCADIGFDEIQFDYVRYPTGTDETLVGVDGAGRQRVITDFAAQASEYFDAYGIPCSLDVFGTIIHSWQDRNVVGQDYQALSYETDFLCPMIYPSHYYDGLFGLDHPDLHPYETVLSAMEESGRILSGELPDDAPEGTPSISPGDMEKPQAGVRPWLQGFTANYLKYYRDYGAAEIKEQIRAVYDAGLEEWLIWDPAEHYPFEAFKKD